MANILKRLSDLFKGGKHLSTWKVLAGIACFVAVTVITFGAAPIGLAMALIMHPDGTTISGRSKGTVFTRNGIRRNFAMPSNPRSALQMARRNALSFFSAAFRALTTVQISEWNKLEMEITNRVGQKKTIKGKTVYVRLNSNLDLIGLPGIDDAPILQGSQGPEFPAKPTIDVSDAEIQSDAGNADAAYGLSVYASLAIPAGRSSAPMSQVYYTGDSSAASGADCWNGYVARYGVAPIAGQTIKVGYQFVNIVTGEASGIVAFNIIVVA